MTVNRFFVPGIALLWAASVAQAQDRPRDRRADRDPPVPITADRTGAFDAILPSRSPLSQPGPWAERFQLNGDLTGWDYDLANESFSLYVPPDYDPNGEPFSVLVWVSPFSDGAIPDDLRSVFDEHHMIWIGPNDAGNPRHLFPRSGLALDAAANIGTYYNVDPDRIFVSGLSGGGRVASMLAVDFSDVFKGAFPIIGVNTFLHVRLESNPNQLVSRFERPAADLVDRARQQPFVIMTGSGDFNREECRLTEAAYEEDGFTDVHLLDIEGMGHEMPDPQDFAAGLDLLLGRP